MEPARLLIGSSYEHKMDISHELIREWAHHFHNMFLEIVNLFGIPGLLMVFWFYWLLLKAVWRTVILDGVPDRPKQLLFVPLLVISGYYMLEAGLFTAMDLRCAEFFFVCGMITAIDAECGLENGNRIP
jgi:O-antigen ligase